MYSGSVPPSNRTPRDINTELKSLKTWESGKFLNDILDNVQKISYSWFLRGGAVISIRGFSGEVELRDIVKTFLQSTPRNVSLEDKVIKLCSECDLEKSKDFWESISPSRSEVQAFHEMRINYEKTYNNKFKHSRGLWKEQ